MVLIVRLTGVEKDYDQNASGKRPKLLPVVGFDETD